MRRGVNDRQLIDDGDGDPITRSDIIDLSAISSGTLLESFSDFASNPDDFLNVDYASSGGEALVEGKNLVVKSGGPWDGPVEVVRRTSTEILLATRDGHLETGWIEFSITDSDDTRQFQIRSTAAAGDRAFLFVYSVLRVGQWVQADLWCNVCEAFARSSGISVPPIVDISTITHDENW